MAKKVEKKSSSGAQKKTAKKLESSKASPKSVDKKAIKKAEPKADKKTPETKPAKAAKPEKKAEKPNKPSASTALPPPEGASEHYKKWYELKQKNAELKAPSYNMTAQYEANTPVQHKVLGWGYILSVQNDRLEVIFESGIKILISNYKS